MVMIFAHNDYAPLKDGETYEGKFVVLRPDHLKPEYREAKNQLFFAQSGFGCDPSKLGGKIFGRYWDEQASTRREHVLGVATERAIQEWEAYYGIDRSVFTKEVMNG